MFKKIVLIVMVVTLTLFNFDNTFIYAEDEETDERSDYEKCMQDHDVEACKAIASDLSSSISSIQDQIKSAQGNKEEALALAQEYALKADSLQTEIDTLSVQIKELETKIVDLEKQIEINQAKVAALNSRVKNRMENSQKTMHFNGYLSFILGSKSFSDMLRRIYGINAIMSKDKSDREEYIDVITALSNDKEELAKSKDELDKSYQEIVTKQAELIVMEEFYEEEASRIQDELDQMTAEMDEIYDSFDDLSDALKDTGVSFNNGFVAAVHNSWISGGVWNYSSDFLGGRWHLGVDYAASRGTPIHAPAGGVIIRANSSCSDPGRLGSSCGFWISGGGNQVYLMAEVKGSVYGFIFFHLSSVNVAYGDKVLQDEVIGTVGSSGSSTGPHCHIEMYYLGDGTLNEYLKMNWNSTFSVGRGATAYFNRCDVSGAPCILDPEKYLPEN